MELRQGFYVNRFVNFFKGDSIWTLNTIIKIKLKLPKVFSFQCFYILSKEKRNSLASKIQYLDIVWCRKYQLCLCLLNRLHNVCPRRVATSHAMSHTPPSLCENSENKIPDARLYTSSVKKTEKPTVSVMSAKSTLSNYLVTCRLRWK